MVNRKNMSKKFLDYLIENNHPIYCAVRLFSPQERIAGANLAGALEAKLHEFIPNASDYVFLPYRDTKQSNIIGNNRAEIIYKLDIEKLRKSSAIMARFDGLAKDSGISMEIGYAYGINIPIGILFTDFMWEGFNDNDSEWTIDPIIKLMSDCIVTVPSFGKVHSSYYHSNIEHEYFAVHRFIDECLTTFTTKLSKNTGTKNKTGIYIDIMGGRYEWSRQAAQYISESLCESFKIPVNIASRYVKSNSESIYQYAHQDINLLKQSSIAIFCGDAPELDAGSAALLGLARAQGIYIIFQYSSNIVYKGLGGQKMKGNLMLEYAADIITSSLEETIHIAKTKLLEERSRL
jgi:nucleoside 2-deoxyribosyltransferase